MQQTKHSSESSSEIFKHRQVLNLISLSGRQQKEFESERPTERAESGS